jgi:hypothetical protein
MLSFLKLRGIFGMNWSKGGGLCCLELGAKVRCDQIVRDEIVICI